MYRPQNESRYCESSSHEQNPFFRETITIIDECTKLMKEDRIFLRNKIKDYLKELKENRHREEDWEHEQMQILLQIFVDANKKKSLSKIQKGDKVMDWLQIKLRKFIDSNKKERHKKEVQSFRKAKGLNTKKQLQSHVYLEKSLQKSREFPASNGHRFMDQINKLSFNFEAKKKATLPKYSLSKSNQKSLDQSRRKFSRKQPSSNLSFYKQFDYLKKSTSREKQPVRTTASSLLKNKFLHHEARPLTGQLNKLNKSLDSHKSIEKKVVGKANQNKGKIEQNFYKNKNIKQTPIQNELTKNQIDKLTQLFTHHLNSQQQSKRNPQKNSKQAQFLFPQKNPRQETGKPAPMVHSESNSDGQASLIGNSSRYEASNKKIQQMLRNSKQILSQYQERQERHQNSFKYPNLEPIVIPKEITVAKSSSNEDLFTPPDFLAECRKYMFSSSKKRTEEDILAFQSEQKTRQAYKQTTFSDILNESRQKSIDKNSRLNHYGINQAISQNASANLSTNKPESEVHYQYRNYSITTIESLLKEIFKISHKTTLDRFRLGEIMSRCNPETQQLFQKYCDVLNLQSTTFNQRLNFDFVATVKYFYTLGKILQSEKEYFSVFLTEILDIRKKGFIEYDDILNFFESLQSSQLDFSILNSIHSLLSNIFKLGCEVEGGNIMTHWSIYYLELKGDKQLLNLKQLLNKFEFQLDQEGDQ